MKKEYLTNAKVLPPAVTTVLKAVIRLVEEVEASLPTALQTYVCLFTAHVDQTLLVGLFLATATSILISNYQSVLEPL